MATDCGSESRRQDGKPPLRALSLTDNVPMITATANDDGYAAIFVAQLRLIYRPGDVLVVISASGNSPNIVAAARWVKAHGGKVLGLLGFDGGAVKGLCDTLLHVKTATGEYGPVEDVHSVFNHLLTARLNRPTPMMCGGAQALGRCGTDARGA